MNARKQQAFLRSIAGNQLLSLFELLPDVSFFLKDREGRFVALNRRGCEYCGVRSEREAWGKTDYDFFSRRRADEYRRDDKAVMDSGEAIVNRIESAPEQEGSPRLVLTSKIPLRDHDGNVVGLAGVSRQTDQVREVSESTDKLGQVIEQLHRQPEESVNSAQLAAKVGLSVSQFDRIFRRTLGTSPRQYLLRVRVEAACRRLAESNQTISEIAYSFGFHDHAHFSRIFRQVMGTTPSAYRIDHQGPSMISR
jgi:PAS domain S-box-containing protein